MGAWGAAGAGAVVGALLAVIPAPALGQAARPPEVLYLNFSDGREDVLQSSYDRARDNRSEMGTVLGYPAFDWERFRAAGESREAVVRAVTDLVDRAFGPYDILVSSVRPARDGYSMIMIGGGPSLFQYPAQVAGVALLDCGNRQSGNVAFAFSENLPSVQGLWVTIAQEAAHTLGLEHTNDDRDVMYPTTSPSQTGFLDEDELIVSPGCGPLIQNSHQKLRQVLGDWSGGAKPATDGSGADPSLAAAAGPDGGNGLAAGGCAVGGPPATRGGFPAAAAIALAAAFFFCYLRLRRRG